RAALDAPEWRWMGLNHANAALTVIRYAPGRPPAPLRENDTAPLPHPPPPRLTPPARPGRRAGPP
ncbi:hypothetical protein ACFV5C_09585, partial [Streptomyces sp. NPDC059762]